MNDWCGPQPGDASESGLISDDGGAARAGALGVTGATLDALGGDPHDSLWFFADGMVWDLGPADLDADGDGVPDSVTSDVAGDTAILTDTDGDGRVDRLTRLGRAGGIEVTEFGVCGGEWSPTSLGRLT